MIDTINELVRGGEIEQSDVPSLIASAHDDGQFNYLYKFTTSPKLNPFIDLGASPEDAGEYAFNSRIKTAFDRKVYINSIQDTIAKEPDPAIKTQLLTVLKQTNDILNAADAFHAIYTRLPSQPLSDQQASDAVAKIKADTPNWDSLSGTEQSKLIADTNPQITQGRIWIKAASPEQNIALDSF